MKKLFAFCLLLSGPAWGAYFPPGMTPTGVNASSAAVRNEQGTALAVISTTAFSISNSTIAVRQDGQIWVIGNSTTAVNVLGTVPTTVANSTIAVRQDGQIWVVGNSTIGVTQVGIQTVANSTIAVRSDGSNFTIANSTFASNDLGIVSTNTLPTPAASAANVTQLKDPFGRQIVVGGVHRAMISVATLTVTGTTPVVLVSSGGTNNYNHLCGCIITNTSATNTYVTLYPSGAATSANSLAIGAPANDVPSGIWPGCINPFFTSSVNSSITVIAANSVSSLLLTCQYYTGL